MFCFWRGIFFWPFAALAGLLGYEAAQNNQLNPARPTAVPVDPIEILKARYARGEINKQEFDRVKKDLT